VKDTLDTSDVSFPATTRLRSNCRLAARLAELLGLGVGLAVLLGGWACGIAGRKTVLPEFAPMAPLSIPIVALTAEASLQDVERSGNAGCNAHLSKPISKVEVLCAKRNSGGRARPGGAGKKQHGERWEYSYDGKDM